jgi:hypothetical protein
VALISVFANLFWELTEDGNIPTMSELGRFPVGINVISQIYNYYLHLGQCTVTVKILF